MAGAMEYMVNDFFKKIKFQGSKSILSVKSGITSG